MDRMLCRHAPRGGGSHHDLLLIMDLIESTDRCSLDSICVVFAVARGRISPRIYLSRKIGGS